LANIPGNAYEKGGIFQYIIWDPENNPTVKLVDLRSAEKIRDLNIRLLSSIPSCIQTVRKTRFQEMYSKCSAIYPCLLCFNVDNRLLLAEL